MNMLKNGKKTKKIVGTLTFILVVISLMVFSVVGYSTGRYDKAKTGCDCHSLTADPTVSVIITGLPMEYTPDQTYILTVTVSGGPPTTKGGFNLEISSGTLSSGDINVQTNLPGNQATHTNPNQRTWTVSWRAPIVGSGDVTFWVAGNAANGNGNNGGDGWNLYSTVVPEIPMPENLITLKQGWNLISIPYIQDDQNLSKVLEDIDGNYDVVQHYNGTDTMDPWKNNLAGKTFGNDLNDISEKMGIWIHVTQPGDTIFQYNGTQPVVNQTIPLYSGWNLVGFPSLDSKVRDIALNNIQFDTDVDLIQTYNVTSGSWEELGISDYFEKGRGYWIHSNLMKVWEVPL
jgi:hypothetical protein